MRSPTQTPSAAKPAKAQTDDAQAANSSSGQDAEALIKADHRAVEALFTKYEGETSANKKAEIVEEICKQLIVHSMIEEEIFYPACREKSVEDKALDEAQVEHDGAKILIADLTAGTPDGEYYDAKVAVLSEYIKHHVGEEEKPSDGILAKARTAGVDMSALGQRLRARKEELMAKAEAGSLRPPMPRSLQFRGQPPKRQEYETVDRRSQHRERDDHGRFAGEDDRDRGYSRGSSGGSQSRERDDQGRFMSDDDDHRYSRGSSGRSQGGERDDRGRFMSDDDDRGYSRGSSGHYQGWERDDHGRFASDGDRGYSRGGSGRDERGRFTNDEDDRGYSRGSSGRSQGRERDEQGRFASDDDDRSYSHGRSYGRQHDDDDDRRGSSSRGRGHGGWYGDSEGHSEASHRGWQHRGGGQGRYGDDNANARRGPSRGGSHGGWFGDSEGHSEASRRGWRNRD